MVGEKYPSGVQPQSHGIPDNEISKDSINTASDKINNYAAMKE